MEAPPIACTLNPAAFADRAGAWRALLDDGLLDRERLPDGVRLRLRPAVEERTRELLTLEAECCAWFTATVHSGDPVEVDLVAPGDGPAVLWAMLDEAAPPPPHS